MIYNNKDGGGGGGSRGGCGGVCVWSTVTVWHCVDSVRVCVCVCLCMCVCDLL